MQLGPQFLRHSLETALTFLYPSQCRFCNKHIGFDSIPYFCNVCWDGIVYIESPWCDFCGLPCVEEKCDECATAPPPYGKLRTIAYYETVLQRAIHLYKFEKRKSLVSPLSQLVITRFPEDMIIGDYDYILPIPIHKRRLRERTFNQSTLIATEIAKSCGVKVETNALIRQRNTSPQSSLARVARETNIIGAFRLQNQDDVRGKRILVFDDVYTTGATVREAVKTLWNADPIEVDVLTLARAQHPE